MLLWIPAKMKRGYWLLSQNLRTSSDNLSVRGTFLLPVIGDPTDTGTLATLTKNNPIKATGAHVSIVGDTTDGELRRYLDPE